MYTVTNDHQSNNHSNKMDLKSLPSHLKQILNEIFDLLNGDSDNNQYEFTIDKIDEAKSAQQQVYILFFRQDNNNNKSRAITSINSNDDESRTSASQSSSLLWGALRNGKNRLVLRIWNGGSRWWNLHRNDDPTKLAQQEMMGYDIAHKAFDFENNHLPAAATTTTATRIPLLRIPRVIYFHNPKTRIGNASSSSSCHIPWAILEYVGPDSIGLSTIHVDEYYLLSMVKIRHEFGYDEPHPRWGRVPTDKALQYAQLILQQVIIPLHHYTAILRNKNNKYHNNNDYNDNLDHHNIIYTFSSMIQIYRNAWTSMKQSLVKETDEQTKQYYKRLDAIITTLERYVERDNVGTTKGEIVSTKKSTRTVPIPIETPVLVHMDLQPQNIIFCKLQSQNNVDKESILSKVYSVLDWEDAAWADPRFDILLLCRKVCANQQQANIIWHEYEQLRNKWAKNNMNDCRQIDLQLGPIQPWLQLETAHSITSLLLQTMDLLNGGRNPWENKNDLSGKLRREFDRWDDHF